VTLDRVELADGDIEIHQNIEQGSYLKLSVSDTGCGMDEDTLLRIFEPYFTTKSIGEGSGMGLATVHGIVNDHGGTMKVLSTPGSGTTFHVCFPVMDEAKKVTEIMAPELLPKGKERILLVDDEKPLIDIGQKMLEDLGYRVEGRTSSFEALEAFRANPEKFDMVITDMTMPNMTGEGLAKELMEIRSDIPVLLCTGFSKTMNPEKADNLGIEGLLMKPLSMQELARTVRKVFDELQGKIE